jgi:site-specific DNA-cytosine methylase
MKVLQCSGYGSPQVRSRLIIIFAKVDVSLPSFPTNTHATARQAGLYSTVTVSDAVSDLPKWDMQNGNVFTLPQEVILEIRQRVPTNVPVQPDGNTAGPRNARYTCRPRNDYQKLMRSNKPSMVTLQYTIPPISQVQKSIEQMWLIPFVAGANHLHFQGNKMLALPDLVNTAEEGVFENSFRRIDAVSSERGEGLHALADDFLVLGRPLFDRDD